MRNIRAVIFDVGRVLVRIDPAGEKFSALLDSMGIPPQEAFNKFAYSHEVRRLMTGEVTPEEFHQIVLGRFGITLGFADFAEAWADLFHPVPAMEQLFSRLAERYSMGILSDTDPMHWNALRSQFPWIAAVEKPTLSFEVGRLKPHPDMYAAAAASCGCRREHCLFIDDLLENVDGARYFGMPALHFKNAEKLEKDLTGLRIL